MCLLRAPNTKLKIIVLKNVAKFSKYRILGGYRGRRRESVHSIQIHSKFFIEPVRVVDECGIYGKC